MSVFSKIVERLMAMYITDHLESNKILSESQFGFRRNRSTQDAVLQIQNFVVESFEKEMIPVAIFLDFSAAFDSVQHPRLIGKLRAVGITDEAIALLESYLKDRSQQLRCNENNISDHTKVECGVPQGGSLSSILFSVFINDLLKNSSEHVSYVGYADDITLLFRFEKQINYTALEKETQRVSLWSTENGLSLNPSKSNYMIFGPSIPETRPLIRIHQEDCKDQRNCLCDGIQNVQKTKYLGTVVDEKLSWKDHQDRLTGQLRAATATIVKLRQATSIKTTVTAYKALFDSNIRYCILAYMSTFRTSIESISRIQNNVMRKIFKKKLRDPTDSLYKHTTILPVKLIYIECVLIECLIKSKEKTDHFIATNTATHNYGTRNATIVRLPTTRLRRTEKMHMHRYLTLLQAFREELIMIRTLETRKKKKAIRRFVINNAKKLMDDFPM